VRFFQLKGLHFMVVRRGILAALLTMLLTSITDAQTLTFNGRVTDPQGGVVVNATVSLTSATAPRSRTVRTTAEGTFIFEGIAPGRYTVQVDAPGFVTWAQEVSVAAGARPIVIALQIAGIIEDVQVSGTAPYTLSKPAPTGSRLGLSPLETPASVA
jgi:protocatechuate 3,4-dioxygenase beta subunit